MSGEPTNDRSGPVDVERLPQMVPGRRADQRAERVEFTRPSVVRAVGVIAAVALGAVLVVAASTVVWWLVIAAVVGALLHPANRSLKRRLPTALALLIIVVVVLGLAGWLGFRGLNEVKDQAESVRSAAVADARQVEASAQYGSTAQKVGLSDRVNSAFAGIPGSSSDVTAPLQFVSSSGGALFSIAMLSLLFVLFWPELFNGALRQAGSSVRHELVALHLRRSYRNCVRYAWLMMARAVAVGLVAAAAAQVLGVGAPTLIGLWFASCSIVPGIGLVIAGAPMAALEAIHAPGPALALLVVIVAVQAVDAAVVQKRIERTSVRVGPTVSLLAILIGFELYGIGGAVVVLAAASFGLAFLASLTAYRRDLTQAVKDLTRTQEETTTARQTTAAVTDEDGSVTWWYELGWRSPLLAGLAAVGLATAVAVALAGPIVALGATAVLLSFGIDPLITRFQHWIRLPRGFTVAIVFCLATAVALGGLAAFLPSTVDQAGTVQQDLPKAVNDLATLPIIGPVLADNHAPDKIRDWANELPAQIANDPSGITSAASSIGTAVLAALLVAFLLVALLIDGPRLVRALTVAIPEPRVGMLSRVGNLVANTAGRYFSGSLVLAGLQAIQVLVTGLALGVPLTPLLALWAGVWTMVPQIGGAIGGIPFILLAFSHSATAGVIAAAAFGVYLVIANNVLLPVIVGKAVDASPLATMAATIAGFTLLGVIGAVLAVPVFGATKAIYKQLRPTDPPRPEPPRHRPGRVRTRAASIRTRAAGPPPLVPSNSWASTRR